MPFLHRTKTNGKFYVVANIGGNLVTYQTKWSLHQRFCKEDCKEGDHIDQTEAIRLAQSGELYTKGIAPFAAVPHPELVFHPEDPPADSPLTQTTESSERPPLDEESNSPEPKPEPERTIVATALVALVLLAVLVLWMLGGV